MFDNTVNTLAAIPAAIVNFYHEEVRSLPTGNQVSESYTYEDENGVTQSATRMVDEYADITYVVENTRAQGTSWSQVDNIIELRAGTLPNVVDSFIGFALETEDWEYHDSYLEYLAIEPQADDPKYLEEVPESDPVEYVYDYTTDYAAWVADAPVQDADVTVAQWKMDNYQKLRRAAYGDWTTQLEHIYDDEAGWRAHILSIRNLYPSC